MTNWSDDDKLRQALIDEISAQLAAPAQPGDMTAEHYADAMGLSLAKARYRLDKLVREGVLIAVRADVPGRPRPTTVYRRP
jgi:predicted ArsR family transcriptional regulator